jgi:formamidopyrimidine-DNA glycosylase
LPELPEVETIRRQLEPLVVGRRLGEAWAFPHPKFTPALEVGPALVERVGRRGKYLLIGLDDDRELVVHLGMTGSLRVRPGGDDGDAYVRAWWRLDDGPDGGGGALEYRDVRRFGRIAVATGGVYTGTLAVQGPDALDRSLTAEAFWRSLRGSRRAVKTQLLSQRPIAGVGNIYADEALWVARLHGDRPGNRLRRADAVNLLAAVRTVMAAALAQGGTSFDALYVNVNGESGYFDRSLEVYGREGEPCSRCGSPIVRVSFMNRSSFFCPRCQPRPRRRTA